MDPTTIGPIIVFTSPKAGSGANREQIPRLRELLKHRGFDHQFVHSPVELEAIVSELTGGEQQPPCVIAAGGDGTLSLAASKTRPETRLIPMPMGTENLLARMIGQSAQAEAVMQTLTDGNLRRIDAGSANGRLFLIMATAGFDAEVVRRLHLRRKGHIRRTSYLAPIWQTLQRYRFPSLRVSQLADDGSVIEETTAAWAMVFNLPRYAAGLQIAPQAVENDGMFDVVALPGQGFFKGMQYVAGAIRGRLETHADVRRFHAQRLRVEADERVAFELDGDYVGRLPLVIENLPLRVTLQVPPNRSHRPHIDR
ncbi:diacylglycerol kinase family protein [Roseiconus lacunae]|uniref:diacylglycerol/lipid kinase family protein n=1 Tax=Roseiconus lacunae TaxID=2605694 RepID=UPI00308A317D|nr:diacylglycerol kinase family protein [Stieleria sp. HD01]